jgi:uncharacterized protein YdiU (UPF0061 family)
LGPELGEERTGAWVAWVKEWRAALAEEGLPDEQRAGMQDAVNPAYVPRNQVMQEAIARAEAGDFTEVGPCSRLPALAAEARREWLADSQCAIRYSLAKACMTSWRR